MLWFLPDQSSPPASHASHSFAVLAPLPRPAPVLSRPHPANCPECVCEIAIASGNPGEEDPANLYRIVGAVNPQLPERGLLKWNRPCKVRHCLTLHKRRNRILSLPRFYLGNFVYHKNRKMIHNSILCITGETQDIFVSHFCKILIRSIPGQFFEKNYQLLVSVIAINREKR